MAVTASAKASEWLREFHGVKIKLSLLTDDEEDRPEWKESFEEILQRLNLTETGLSFQADVPFTIKKMEIHMRKSNLFLSPLRQESALFGTETLAAIAAGVPILVSRYSGIARFLQGMAEDESLVYGSKLQSRTNIWKERILERLLRPAESQKAANKLREKLLLDTSIAQTHLDFIRIVAGIIHYLIQKEEHTKRRTEQTISQLKK